MQPSPPREMGILLIFACMEKAYAAKQESAGESRVGRSSFAGGGCEGGAPLLKFHVCWDAAVLRRKRGRLFVR